MKLPEDAIISPAKIKDYLLQRRAENDKSKFLERAGYNKGNWQQLESDLRMQILPLEANLLENTRYGEMFEIRGVLLGTNGVELRVKTIWMTETESGITKFITLYPDKEN